MGTAGSTGQFVNIKIHGRNFAVGRGETDRFSIHFRADSGTAGRIQLQLHNGSLGLFQFDDDFFSGSDRIGKRLSDRQLELPDGFLLFRRFLFSGFLRITFLNFFSGGLFVRRNIFFLLRSTLFGDHILLIGLGNVLFRTAQSRGFFLGVSGGSFFFSSLAGSFLFGGLAGSLLFGGLAGSFFLSSLAGSFLFGGLACGFFSGGLAGGFFLSSLACGFFSGGLACGFFLSGLAGGFFSGGLAGGFFLSGLACGFFFSSLTGCFFLSRLAGSLLFSGFTLGFFSHDAFRFSVSRSGLFCQGHEHAGKQQSDGAQDGDYLSELLRHVFTPHFVVPSGSLF